MTKTTLATGFALTLALPGVALAADFDSMDSNGDGFITMSEFQQAMPDASTEAFMEADADADGALSKEELTAAKEAGTLPKSED